MPLFYIRDSRIADEFEIYMAKIKRNSIDLFVDSALLPIIPERDRSIDEVRAPNGGMHPVVSAMPAGRTQIRRKRFPVHYVLVQIVRGFRNQCIDPVASIPYQAQLLDFWSIFGAYQGRLGTRKRNRSNDLD